MTSKLMQYSNFRLRNHNKIIDVLLQKGQLPNILYFLHLFHQPDKLSDERLSTAQCSHEW